MRKLVDDLGRACADELIELAVILETIARRLVQLVDAPTVTGANLLTIAEQCQRCAVALRTLATLARPPDELGPVCMRCDLPFAELNDRGWCAQCAGMV